MDITQQQVQEHLSKLSYQSQAFINGRYVPSASGKTFDCLSPIDGKKLTAIAACDKEDIDRAVTAARAAFNRGDWSNMTPAERKQILFNFADLIEKHQFELALLETLDMGKPITNSFKGEVPSTVRRIRWTAEAIDKVYGDVAPTANTVVATITHEPAGVVGAITPWNYPLYLACAKIAPALAMGNSVVLKPAEQSPLTALRIAELAAQAGVPEGVLNVVPGMGETAGAALALHNDVDVITFTGSTEVGKLMLQYSAQSNMKRVYLECGGKSPNIVFADYADLDTAAEAQAEGVFTNTGQICCAPTRLIIERSIKDDFLKKVQQYAQNFTPMQSLDVNCRMGSLVDQTQMQRVLDYIQKGQDEGAQLYFGGQRQHESTGGFYIEPTVFDAVDNKMTIAQDEIFGPVLSVIAFDTFEEAIAIANDTTYGLAASVWTDNLSKAHQTARAIRAGVVSVNAITGGDNTTTFGGYKQSGIGRESSIHQFEHYTETKTTWIELG